MNGSFANRPSVKRARKSIDGYKEYKEQKEHMIARFARWLLNKYEGGNQLSVSIGPERILDRHNNTVTFSVHPANGGYVIESSFYSEREDRHQRSLHIITSEEDFAKELGHAVFMDMLKNR